ncbi:MAG: CBS domain-containing protein [Solirubrobacterales bacterium]
MIARLVEEIMDSEPVSVRPDDDVRTVVELLRTHELHGVPVVDGERRVVGIVTESDLVIAEQDAELRLPHWLPIMGGVVFIERFKGFESRLRKALASDVEHLMTADPIVCRTTDPVRLAARLISEHHHNRLPVVDDEGRLAGVVTRVDVVAALIADDDQPA